MRIFISPLSHLQIALSLSLSLSLSQIFRFHFLTRPLIFSHSLPQPIYSVFLSPRIGLNYSLSLTLYYSVSLSHDQNITLFIRQSHTITFLYKNERFSKLKEN